MRNAPSPKIPFQILLLNMLYETNTIDTNTYTQATNKLLAKRNKEDLDEEKEEGDYEYCDI